jgi:hypothetical protein
VTLRHTPGTIREVRLVCNEEGTWEVWVCWNGRRGVPVTIPEPGDPVGSLWEVAQLAAGLETAPRGHGVAGDDTSGPSKRSNSRSVR